MKSYHVYYLAFLLSICFFPTQLKSQTYKQQQASTAVVNHIFGGKYSFNAKATRKASQKDILEMLDENEMITADALQSIGDNLMLFKPSPNWRGIIAELEAECGKIEVFGLSWVDPDGQEGSQLIIFIPPNNKCSKLVDPLAEHLFGGRVSGASEVQRCEAYRCIVPFGSGGPAECMKVITLIDANLSCQGNSSNECADSTECRDANKESATVTVYDTLFMTEK